MIDEYEYNSLMKNLEWFRNEMWEQKDILKRAMIEKSIEGISRRREWAAYNYALKQFDILTAHYLNAWRKKNPNGTNKLTAQDNIVMKEAIDEL